MRNNTASTINTGRRPPPDGWPAGTHRPKHRANERLNNRSPPPVCGPAVRTGVSAGKGVCLPIF